VEEAVVEAALGLCVLSVSVVTNSERKKMIGCHILGSNYVKYLTISQNFDYRRFREDLLKIQAKIFLHRIEREIP
jgi:hypothetical protein